MKCDCYNKAFLPVIELLEEAAGKMYFRTGYHYNKEACQDGYVSVRYIATENNISDTTTKGLAPIKFTEFDQLINGELPLPDEMTMVLIWDARNRE